MVISNVDLNLGIYFFGVTGSAFEEARFKGWLSLMYALIALPIGMIIANFIFLKKINITKNIQIYYNKKTTFYLTHSDNAVYITLCLALVISTISILYVFYTIGNIPILSLFQNLGHEALAQIRFNAKLGFSGVSAIKDIFAINLTILISYILYIYYINTKLYKFKILFYYSFILSILMSTYNLEKIPMFFYLAGFLLLNILYYSKISMKKIIKFVIFVLISLIGVYSLFSHHSLVENIVSIFSRIFVGAISAIYLGFEYFPSQQDFIGIRGISNLFASFVGEENVMYGIELYKHYNPTAVANNTAGMMVAFFTAESWILFGLWGVIIIPLYVGFFIQSIHILFLKLPKNPFFIAFYVFITLRWSLTGGVSHILYPIILVVTIIIFIQLLFVSNMLQGIKK
jgi:hypothetical protein